jgi:hypothetical protein
LFILISDILNDFVYLSNLEKMIRKFGFF